MPEISIIIPVYNVQDYLDKCVHSIMNQSFHDFELILVDDGSTDNSSQMCDRYAQEDSRVVVVHQNNGGVSKARNVGLSIARADWVTFVDSDDWVERDYLANFHLDDDSADIYIQGLQFVNSNTKIVTEEKELPNISFQKSDFSTLVPKYNILALGFPVCKRYKRSIIEDYSIRFDERLSHHEDHIFVFEYLLHVNNMSLSSGLNYNYRYFHNPNSLSSKSDDISSMRIAYERMLCGFNSLLKEYNITDAEYIKRVGTLCVKPIISAIISEYRLRESKRSQLLKQNMPEPEILKRYYSPSDNLGKTVKFFAENNMLFIVHACLSLYQFLRK